MNGLGLLAIIVGLIVLYLIAHYIEWRCADRNRRFERSVQVQVHDSGKDRGRGEFHWAVATSVLLRGDH